MRASRRTFLVCLGLTALVWAVFGQTLRHDFINFDDDLYVYDNALIKSGLTIQSLVGICTHAHANLWHPLTSMTHMLDCQLFGLNPAGHHFTNVLLHNAGAILLFFAFRNLTGGPGRTGSFWRSAFVAAVFAVHPMRVESVAWVAERKDVLSGIFFALTLIAYARYARTPSLARYATMSILYACGLLSKATLVVVPALLLVFDWWPLERAQRTRDWPRLMVEKLPLFVFAAASTAVTIAMQTVTMASLAQLPLMWRMKNAIVSAVVYLRQFFWPDDLAIFYPHPHDQLPAGLVLACAALLLVLTLIFVVSRRNHPYLSVGWAWYLIMLFPLLGLFQAGLQARADRFTYLPHIGLTMMTVWSVDRVTAGWRSREKLLTALGGFSVAAMALVSWQQTTCWRDSVSVWSRALAVTANNQMAHKNLGAALWQRGQIAEANAQARISERIRWETILKDYPLDSAAHDQLGVLLVQDGKLHEAIAHWETALHADPDDGNALNNLAWTLATNPDDSIRDGARAVTLAEKMVALPGGNVPIVLRTLAAAYAENGEFARAIETAARAAQMAEAQQNPALAQTLRHEIELYRQDRPYREVPAHD